MNDYDHVIMNTEKLNLLFIKMMEQNKHAKSWL